ncbi:MAG: hypothetical protein EB060_06730 [Proteobacteria bacterium]|nr:hypothetical protein [Pseudomonadota bacterium]
MKKLALVILLFAFPAFAVVKASPDLDQIIMRKEPTFEKVGAGSVKFFGMKIYDSELWAPKGHYGEKSPTALGINYKWDVNRKDLVRTTREELVRVGNFTDEQLDNWSAQLADIYPDIRNGDTIVAFAYPNKRVVFFYNGKYAGEVADPVFANEYLNIWLSEKTSEPDARKAMLGMN